jgi:type IV pilus assembly protein PilX
MKHCKPQTGASLIIVMLLLIVVSVLGVGGIQIAMMSEKATRSDRDKQIAWQATEAALLDAEYDILGITTGSATQRNSIFKLKATDISKFVAGCGTSGTSKGLCAYDPSAKPGWLTVDFEATGNSAATTEFGSFTGRTFPSGSAGIQPAKAPRYVIEPIPDPYYAATEGPEKSRYIYRITAMGFGPNADTQTVLQMIYRN